MGQLDQGFIVLLTVFFAIFTQTLTGFGLGVVAMPIISATLGLDIARPLMVLVATTSQLYMTVRLRKSLTFGAVGALSIFSLVGIPVGGWLADSGTLSEQTLLLCLAVLIVSYSLYALISPTLPYLKTDRWSGVAGIISGVLTGAYNVGGPPVVIYADARRWSPETLRVNLQGFFLFKALTLLAWHASSQNLTAPVWTSFLWAIPAMVLGIGAGFWLYPHINAGRFRQMVLVLLLILGLKIIYDVLAG